MAVAGSRVESRLSGRLTVHFQSVIAMLREERSAVRLLSVGAQKVGTDVQAERGQSGRAERYEIRQQQEVDTRMRKRIVWTGDRKRERGVAVRNQDWSRWGESIGGGEEEKGGTGQPVYCERYGCASNSLSIARLFYVSDCFSFSVLFRRIFL